MESRKKIIIYASLALLFALLAASAFWFFKDAGAPAPADRATSGQADGRLTSQDAFKLAEARAKAWQAEAALSRFSSADNQTSFAGRADDWEFLFVSKKKTGVGYRIMIKDRQVVAADEIPFIGEGGGAPEKTIGSEEAIAEAKRIFNDDSLKIISVQMIYNGSNQNWYWGVKTEKGLLSIKAVK